MVSISKFQSSAQAAQYFQTDIDYYQQNDELGEWSGELAKELGLTGAITKENYQAFANLIESSDNKRSGFDMTFSAPKSVSILHAAASKEVQKLIEEAQWEANRQAIEFAQAYITFRERTTEGRFHFKNNGLAIASFGHFTNRNEEPQLHTHNFIFNQTRNRSGKIVSIDNYEFYKNQKLFGQIYHQKLFQGLKNKLGLSYEIIDYRRDIFEIKGVPKEALEAFSSRRTEIEERVKELKKDPKYKNTHESKLYQIAALDSRKAKKSHDYNSLEAIKDSHREKMKNEFNFDEESVYQLMKEHQEERANSEDEITAEELVHKASRLLNDEESTFRIEKILEIAMKLNVLHDFGAELGELHSAIYENDDLILLGEEQWTTKSMLKIENQIKNKVIEAQTGYSPLASKQATEAHLKEFTHCTSKKLFDLIAKGEKVIKLDQAKMIREVLSSEASINIIQGDAGTGKTFAVKVMKDIIESESPGQYEYIGLAPTSQAAVNIEEDSGIKSSTIHSFLNREQEENGKKRIYIVDEAGMTDSPLMHKLFTKIEKDGGGKIILIGDKKQFQSIGAGGIFTQLQNLEEVQISELTDKTRQKTVVLQEIVKNIEDKNLVAALQTLRAENMIEGNINTIEIAKQYNEDTLIIASTNEIRKEINEQVRSLLGLSGKSVLTRQSEIVLRYERVNVEKYKTGQVLFAQQQIKGMKAGEEGRVIGIDKKTHQVQVEVTSRQGHVKQIEIDIRNSGEHLQVFNEEIRDFDIGDQIVFQKNDRMLGVANGTKGEVVGLDDEGNIQIKTSEVKTAKFNLKDYNYLDHAYALTNFKSQGVTQKNVIAAVRSKIATNNSFYVEATRAAENLKIYTDDISRLIENAAQAQIKTSTLDHEAAEELLKSLNEEQNDDVAKKEYIKELKKLEKSALKALPITKIMQRKGGKIVENLKLAFNIAKLQNQYGYKKFKDRYHKNHIRKIQRKHAVAVTLNNEKMMQLAGVKNIEDAKWLLNRHKIGFKKIEKIEEREVKIFGTIYLDSRAGWLNKIQKELNRDIATEDKSKKKGAEESALKQVHQEDEQGM